MHPRTLCVALGAALAAAAHADVTFTSSTTTIWGGTQVRRQNSHAERDYPQQPFHQPGLGAGLTEWTMHSTSGPLAPSPSNPTFVGTTAVAKADGESLIYFPDVWGPDFDITVDILLTSRASLASMDGGLASSAANAFAEVTFTLDVPTPFTLIVTSGVSNGGTASGSMTGVTDFGPAGLEGSHDGQGVTFSGTLAAGTYTLTGTVGANLTPPQGATGTLPTRFAMERLRLSFGDAVIPGCIADIGSQGGVWHRDGEFDNNDFIVFIDMFFSHCPATDVGTQGGVLGSDGVFDNNDFVAFIDAFFSHAGCV